MTVIKELIQKLDPTVSALGYEIVDIETTIEYGEKHLTVYIDKIPDGVSLDDCEKVHNAIDAVMDELDPTKGEPYVLEVSSPGLDRPFKTQRDFERNYGREVEVKLYAPLKGKKVFDGVLIERNDTYLIIEKSGQQTKLEMNRIAIVRPLIKFE